MGYSFLFGFGGTMGRSVVNNISGLNRVKSCMQGDVVPCENVRVK